MFTNKELAASAAATLEPIVVSSDDDLRSIEGIIARAKALDALGLSRQKTTGWITSQLFEWKRRGGIVLLADGTVFPIHRDIEDDWGQDTSAAFNSNSKRFATRRPKRRAKRSDPLLARLRAYDAAFKIAARLGGRA